MPGLSSFDETLQRQPEYRKRHLLLGNGFSIACKRDIFTYGALLDRANFAGLDPECREAFDVLGTTSFEVVMAAMKMSAALARLYLPDRPDISERLISHSEALKGVLVHAIADSHPEHPFEIPDEAYVASRVFLANFYSVYTLSYDLLLYWSLMRHELDPLLKSDDGFRQPDDGPAEYVTWEVENTDSQNIHYFHGALHLFDAGHELKKFTWTGTRIRLLEQIRDALDRGLFPLIVTEGDSDGKLRQINHHTYLSRAYRSFSKIGNALYVFGFSFSESDEHILRLLEKNKVTQLFVSIFGDPNSPENQRIMDRIQLIDDRRPRNRPLSVFFYPTADAHVWG